MNPNKEVINVIYKKDVGYIPNCMPKYIVKKFDFEELNLALKIKLYKKKGITDKQIKKKFNLSTKELNYYLTLGNLSLNRFIENYEISYLPNIYLNHLEEISDLLCYDFDELDEINKNLYQDNVIKYEKQENGLYKLGEKTYKIKRKIKKQV